MACPCVPAGSLAGDGGPALFSGRANRGGRDRAQCGAPGVDQWISGCRGNAGGPRSLRSPCPGAAVRSQCRTAGRRPHAPPRLTDLGMGLRHHRGAAPGHPGTGCRLPHQRSRMGAQRHVAASGVASGQRSVCIAATRGDRVCALRPRNGDRYATCATVGSIVNVRRTECARDAGRESLMCRVKRDVRHRETTTRHEMITNARFLELFCAPAGRVRQRCMHRDACGDARRDGSSQVLAQL